MIYFTQGDGMSRSSKAEVLTQKEKFEEERDERKVWEMGSYSGPGLTALWPHDLGQVTQPLSLSFPVNKMGGGGGLINNPCFRGVMWVKCGHQCRHLTHIQHTVSAHSALWPWGGGGWRRRRQTKVSTATNPYLSDGCSHVVLKTKSR